MPVCTRPHRPETSCNQKTSENTCTEKSELEKFNGMVIQVGKSGQIQQCHLLQQQHGHIRSGSVEKPNGGLTPTPALLNLSVFFFTLQSTPPFSASLPSFGSQLLLCLPHMYYSHTTAGSNPSLVPLSVQLWLPDCEGSNTCLVFSAYNETVEARLKNSFMI